jgi:hypothetical protein
MVARAQELNCQVSVQLAPGLQQQETNRLIYDRLQSDLRDFVNNRKWTNDSYLNQERIECSMVITINRRPSTDEFEGTLQIQSRRPVYKSSYNCPMLNTQDNNFKFRYIQDQLIEFDESNINSNLTAVIAYYAYIIVGLDYDSFSQEGGSPYFIKAQNIVNNAQNLTEAGWKAFESLKNRFWLVENLLNPAFKPLRRLIYTYHRLGFDRFTDNIIEARGTVAEGLKTLQRVYNDKPNSFLMQVFCFTKGDEIVNLFSQGLPTEKADVVQTLSMVDPANSSKYAAINGTK